MTGQVSQLVAWAAAVLGLMVEMMVWMAAERPLHRCWTPWGIRSRLLPFLPQVQVDWDRFSKIR